MILLSTIIVVGLTCLCALEYGFSTRIKAIEKDYDKIIQNLQDYLTQLNNK